jgi:hypothetical protein
MPNVGGVQYPYTPQGIAAAQQAQTGLDPSRQAGQADIYAPSGYGSGNSLQDMLRLYQLQNMMQPTFQSVSHRPQASPWGAGIADQASFGYGAPSPNWSQLVGRSLGGLPQASQPTFQSVSHRPQQGSRPVGRTGPTTIPASTNYSAISPSNRIAGNISAVMSGRQGPSPGTSPYLNESGRLSSPPNARPWTGYGPTGQPLPSRQPVQKNYPRG